MSEKIIPSIAKSIFFGEVHEADIFPYPRLSNEHTSFCTEMVDAINKFAEDNIDSRKFDHDAQVPESVWQGLAGLGLCGLAVEEQYGGLQLNSTLYARVFSEIAGIDGSIATMLGAHQSIGYKALLNEGNDQQKQRI
jgi:acyl-CoA dehydrogenase family protein 9